MKRYLSAIFLIFFFSCGDEVENYPVEPTINLTDITFSEGTGISSAPEYDSLVVTFSFTDGDGDFGFDPENEAHRLPPYQPGFFIFRDTGKPVTSDKFLNREVSLEELIHYSDTQLPPYDTLPELRDYCYYSESPVSNSDPLYWLRNEDHYNILVDFFYEDANGVFVEFDFEKEFCTTFDGRVSKRVGVDGPFILKKASTKRGELTYRMASMGFVSLFKDKKMKLRIYIKDLALHHSNVIETPPFFLADI